MSTFPGSPKLTKGGIVLINPTTSAVKRVISMQYNPDTLTRTFQIQSVGGEGGDQAESMRLTGPPVETYKLEAEIDATDQLALPDENADVVETGLHAQLAALETIIYPTSGQLTTNNMLNNIGTLEIVPMESPLTLFVWSKKRIVPVRLTEFSITEEAFDTSLNPIRAKVTLGMRVLSITDLGFNHKGGNLYMVYHRAKESLSKQAQNSALGTMGIGGI